MSMFAYSLAALIASGIFIWQIIKRFYPWLWEDFITIKMVIKGVRALNHYQSTNTTFCTKLIETARRCPHHKFIQFEDMDYTYQEIDEWSNRCARALRKLGLTSGDKVGIMMLNEPAFVTVWAGCNKSGITAAFLNYNLRQKSLLHCIDISEIQALIVGKDDELIKASLQIDEELKQRNIKVLTYGPANSSYESFADIVDEQPFEDCPFSWRKDTKFKDPTCYIFTSGTTGLPKAVNVDSRKCWSGSTVFSLSKPQPHDVVYTAMPLYHSAASLIGVGGALRAGCTVVLRKKFSASQFLPDCRKYGVTIAQYVGETLRYVCHQPATPHDKDHRIRAVLGNGLRPDVWRVFLDRFGPHIRVFEFYAATEGNILFFNFHNHFGCIGTHSPLLKKLSGGKIIKYDLEQEEIVKGADGRAILADYDEPGLLVGKITKSFAISSYKGKKALTEKKILHDVFKKGDAYFDSGDLMKIDRKHRVYFCDRLGDTFRWKGENVSTNEVGDAIAQAHGVREANVYGVQIPGKDGRAGMAAIVAEEVLDFSALYNHIHDALPSYARPLFLRVLKEMEITGTLKQRKVNLKREGYNLGNVGGDRIYFIDNKQETYVPLTKAMQDDIENGAIRM